MNLRTKFKKSAQNGAEFRGVPFWSLNDELDPDELRRQIAEMREAGLGGFFMHARVGLITPYLSPEWIRSLGVCIEEARKLGMKAWLYDEDCWPSGSAGGRVPARGEEYRQKWVVLRRENAAEFSPSERTIAVFSVSVLGDICRYSYVQPECYGALAGDILHFYYEVGDYIDVLSQEAVRAFIEETHELYLREFGKEFGRTIPGIFTDEPQYRQVPWSLELPGRFYDRNGYDIVENLPSIFYDVGEFHKVRYDFWCTVTEMYVEAYSKQIGSWCEEHGLKFTGHQVAEDSLSVQVQYIGAAMPHYRHMHIPGIDHLCRRITDPILVKQASSVAHQLGGRRVLSEMYGCSGWNVSFEDLKWIAEWQFVLGVDLQCQHLSLYSMKGCRKRDYPPSLHYQQPWWKHYRMLNDYFARLLSVLTEGEHRADILVIHPIGSAWAIYNPFDTSEVRQLNQDLVTLSENLLEIHRDFDYGDELIMEELGSVEDGRLWIGTRSYPLVIIPPSVSLRYSTYGLLKDLVESGGLIVTVGQIPYMLEGTRSERLLQFLQENSVHISNDKLSLKGLLNRISEPEFEILDDRMTDAPTIFCQHRRCGDIDIFFMVNISRQERVNSTIRLLGEGLLEEWDLTTAEITPVPSISMGGSTIAEITFEPTQSHLIVLDRSKPRFEGTKLNPEVAELARLRGSWRIKRLDPNSLTIDRCLYRMDNGNWEGPSYVIKLRDELVRRGKDLPLELRFEFDVEFDPGREREIYLVLEDPSQYRTIRINGREVAPGSGALEWWTDISFRKVDMSDLIQGGRNLVELCLDFKAPRPEPEIKDPFERNRARYGTEIENIYVIGDFGVVERSPGQFILVEEPEEVRTGDFVSQGFPFYSGSVVISKEFRIDEIPEGRAYVSIEGMEAIVAEVHLNGKGAGKVAWHPYSIEVTGLLKEGINLLEITLTGSCRNLLGPHHHVLGEPIGVGPDSFRGVACWLDPEGMESTWTDVYNFLPFGVLGDVTVTVERNES